MFFIVYILYSESSDKYYAGCTNDIKRRLSEHNRVKGKYTDRGIPWTLVYSERYPSRGLAESREAEIKSKKSRIFIERLIALEKPLQQAEHPDLSGEVPGSSPS